MFAWKHKTSNKQGQRQCCRGKVEKLLIRSAKVLPLLNLSVEQLLKSMPYGNAFALASVLTLLLFPASTVESPKTNKAGTIFFLECEALAKNANC